MVGINHLFHTYKVYFHSCHAVLSNPTLNSLQSLTSKPDPDIEH